PGRYVDLSCVAKGESRIASEVWALVGATAGRAIVSARSPSATSGRDHLEPHPRGPDIAGGRDAHRPVPRAPPRARRDNDHRASDRALEQRGPSSMLHAATVNRSSASLLNLDAHARCLKTC